MAMLRNLRNLIKANVRPKYHNAVISRLQNEKAVVNSKQFPFRFFSAYDVLSELLEPKQAVPVTEQPAKPKKACISLLQLIRLFKQVKRARAPVEEFIPPKELIERYKNVRKHKCPSLCNNEHSSGAR